MKKILSLVLAVMMIAVMGLAFAADNDGDTKTDGIAGNTNGTWADKDTPVVQTASTAKLYKEITFYNPESVDVNAPTITYTYTVTAGESGKEIYDAEANHDTGASAHAYTKQGIVDGVKVNGTAGSGTVSFTPADKYAASSAGTKQTKPINIDFSGVTFTGAGIYRYVVTETAATYNSSGVVQGTTGHVRYLDVYVKDHIENNAASGYEIYGFVCFTNNNSIDGRSTPTLSTPAAAGKTEGFVANTDPNGDGETDDAITADEYYTFNLTIAKTLVGDQAMNNNQFPFSLSFANSTVTGNVLPIVNGSGTHTKPTLTTAGAITSFAEDGTNLKIANGGSVTYVGIPVGTTVTINEQNNVTGTVYTTSTTGGTTNQTTVLPVSWGTWTNNVANWTAVTALQKTANDNTVKADENMTVTFTNTLLQISPTGYVARIAPYALMLAAGVILLVLGFKRRTKKEEA